MKRDRESGEPILLPRNKTQRRNDAKLSHFLQGRCLSAPADVAKRRPLEQFKLWPQKGSEDAKNEPAIF
jgi:hypothetical protein